MARKKSDLSPEFDKARADALVVAKSELQAAAKAHGVKIRAAQIVLASLPNLTIVHAPLVGIEAYQDADFAAGVPIQLLLIKATKTSDVPSGSYVVTAQHRPRATSGKAIFTDRSGVVVTERKLNIRKWKEWASLFPEVYSGGEPSNIPVITSTHVWHAGHWAVDCAGWQPPKVFYY